MNASIKKGRQKVIMTNKLHQLAVSSRDLFFSVIFCYLIECFNFESNISLRHNLCKSSSFKTTSGAIMCVNTLAPIFCLSISK